MDRPHSSARRDADRAFCPKSAKCASDVSDAALSDLSFSIAAKRQKDGMLSKQRGISASPTFVKPPGNATADCIGRNALTILLAHANYRFLFRCLPLRNGMLVVVDA
jgi:hypothetical protein